MSKRRHGSSGQAAVIFTLVMVTLLGALALCTDVALLYFNWAQLQKAADAAAVAGAHYLPNDTTTATSTAYTYANYDGVPASQVLSISFGNGNTTITVQLQRQVNLFFARALGFLNLPVTVQATAEVVPAGGAGNLLPIGLSCTTSDPSSCGMCTTGDPITCQIKYGQLSSDAGNWEPLALNANGANDYRTYMASGYQGPPAITVGESLGVNSEPGNMMGPTLQGLNTRLGDSSYSSGSVGSADVPPPSDLTSVANDSRLVVVPMVQYTGNGKISPVDIMSFALMWIGSVSSDGTINAYFITSGTNPGDLLPNSNVPGSGAYAVTLIQ
jgi:hypothetical protein